MTTGKEATPVDVEARVLIDPTVPNTGVVAPDGVMTAWSPVVIWPTSVSSTVVLTT